MRSAWYVEKLGTPDMHSPLRLYRRRCMGVCLGTGVHGKYLGQLDPPMFTNWPIMQHPYILHTLPTSAIQIHRLYITLSGAVYTPLLTSGYTSNLRCVVTGMPARAEVNISGSERAYDKH